jgi:hypothetical protein
LDDISASDGKDYLNMDFWFYLVRSDEVLLPDEMMEESRNRQGATILPQVQLFHDDLVYMLRCEPNMDVY